MNAGIRDASPAARRRWSLRIVRDRTGIGSRPSRMSRSKSDEGEIVCIVGKIRLGQNRFAPEHSWTDRPPLNTKIEGSVIFRGLRLLETPEWEMRQIRGREVGFISQNPMSRADARAHDRMADRGTNTRPSELVARGCPPSRRQCWTRSAS